MNPSVRATLCLLTSGNSEDDFRRCLQSIIDHAPLDQLELRLGFNQSVHGFYHAAGVLCPDQVAPEWHPLPRGIERFGWTGKQGRPIRAWMSQVRAARDFLLRHLFHDVPLETEYVVCLDDDSVLQPGWWEALGPLLDKGFDCIGQPRWHDYLPGQMEQLQTYPWYMGVPFDRRDRRLGVSYMAGEFRVLRAERLREANFPDLSTFGNADRSQQYSSDILLGEIARQLGWSALATEFEPQRHRGHSAASRKFLLQEEFLLI
jgi:Glycosyl transferase family 2